MRSEGEEEGTEWKGGGVKERRKGSEGKEMRKKRRECRRLRRRGRNGMEWNGIEGEEWMKWLDGRNRGRGMERWRLREG